MNMFIRCLLRITRFSCLPFYVFFFNIFRTVRYHLSRHAPSTFGRYDAHNGAFAVVPIRRLFPRREIKIHRRCVFPRGGIEGIRRREGEDRKRERGKSDEVRTGRKERSSLGFPVRVRNSCAFFSVRAVYFFKVKSY